MDQLSGREIRLRLAGEILAFVGLLLLLAGLYAWRRISGFDYLQYNMIHIPDVMAQAAYLKQVVQSSILPEFRNIPAAAPVFTAILLFGALSVLLRKRMVMVWAFLGFCLVPWALAGLVIPGVQVTSSMILISLALGAMRKGDRRRAVLFGASFLGICLYFSFSFMNPMGAAESRSAIILSAGQSGGHLTASSDLKSFQPSVSAKLDNAAGDKPRTYDQRVSRGLAQIAQDSSLPQGARSYVAAQQAFFLGQPRQVADNLPAALAYFGQSGSFEANRLKALGNYISNNGFGDPGALASYENWRSRVHFVSVTLISLAVLAGLCGTLLEALAGRIVGRSGRMDKLQGRISGIRLNSATGPGATARSQPNSMTSGLAGVRMLRRRTLTLLILAAPLLLAGVVAGLISLNLSLPSVTSNGAFAKVHVLAPALSGFPDGFVNVSQHRDLLILPTGPMTYALLALVNIVALALRRYRYFVAILICSIAYGQYDYFVASRAGIVEVALTDIKPSTIEAMKSYISRPLNRAPSNHDARNAAAYGYLLAQVAYLNGQAGATQTYLAASRVLDHWAIPSTEWRVAVIEEWLVAHGAALPVSAGPQPLASPADFRLFSKRLGIIALILLALASPFIMVAGLLHWRRLRIDTLIASYASAMTSQARASLR